MPSILKPDGKVYYLGLPSKMEYGKDLVYIENKNYEDIEPEKLNNALIEELNRFLPLTLFQKIIPDKYVSPELKDLAIGNHIKKKYNSVIFIK